MNSIKPTVKINSAFIGGNRLLGIVEDYPEEHKAYLGCLTNGEEVTTSPIVSRDGDIVETLRTIYHVQSWIKK